MVYILQSQDKKNKITIDDSDRISFTGAGLPIPEMVQGTFKLLDATDDQGKHYVVHGRMNLQVKSLIRSQPKPNQPDYTQFNAWEHEYFANGAWYSTNQMQKQDFEQLKAAVKPKFTSQLADATLQRMNANTTARVPKPTQAKFAPAAPINILASLQQQITTNPAVERNYLEDDGWDKVTIPGEWTWQETVDPQRQQRQGKVTVKEKEVVASVTGEAIRKALHVLVDAHLGKPLTLNLTANGNAQHVKEFAENYIAQQGWLITINHPQLKQPQSMVADENVANVHAIHTPT